MQLLGFSASQVHPLDTLDAARDFLSGNAAARFVWADFGTEEVTPAPGAWRDSLMALTGAPSSTCIWPTPPILRIRRSSIRPTRTTW
jgi:hypothetical protein